MTALIVVFSIASQLAKLQYYTPDGKFVRPPYVVFDRWPDHKPRTIFASLWRDDGGQEVVAFHVTEGDVLQRVAAYEADIRGIELKDVTGDGVPELLVTGSPGNRGSGVEILQWTGDDFDELGETSDNAAFIDIDGDGIPEIIEGINSDTNECDGPTGPVYVRKLKDGYFEKDPHPNLLEVDDFTKQGGGPETLRFSWNLPDAVSTKCTLRVVNGKKRVTSLHVTVAGKTIAPHEGAQSIELPSRCVDADVTVTGARGASVVLLLESR